MNTPPMRPVGGDGGLAAAPDDKASNAPETDASEDCVSLKSLAMPDADNGDQMANPEVGDKVQYQVEGTVTRIEGENAYVKRDSVNGEPVEGPADGDNEDEPDADDQERTELGGMAGQMGAM